MSAVARTGAAALALLLAATLSAPPVAAGSGQHNRPAACGDAAVAELRALGVAESEIARIALVKDLKTHAQGTEIIVGVTAWVRLRGKKGTLAIVMDRNCNIKTRFTQGEIRVEGVPHH